MNGSLHHNRLPLPTRIYEPTIIHNPLTWMGIWTPQGWRVHKKRFGRADRKTVRLSGDGVTTLFRRALFDPETDRVEWQDDLHVRDDPFTDGGIYPCDPRVEYPPGQPRWAVSHTLLCYPVADHNLYTHEYTWDLSSGDLRTHFREHVICEKARTDPIDGRTVRISQTPICSTIEGNVHYPNQNSAVRGVWTNPQKSGQNYYARRVVQKIAMLNGVYAYAPLTPVIQCRGMYRVSNDDRIEGLFDPHGGECRDEQRLIESLRIPLDEPKLGLLDLQPYQLVQSRVYEGQVSMPSRNFGFVDRSHLDAARRHVGTHFEVGRVGYAYENAVDSDSRGYSGYTPRYDMDSDGIVSEQDIVRIERHLGREVRLNLYQGAYFGGDWLSTTVLLTPNHESGALVVADYDVGGGYDAASGTIRLLETPGADREVWVEYYHEVPAVRGNDNIVVHLYRESAPSSDQT